MWLQAAHLLSSVGFSTLSAESACLWKNHTWWELWNNAVSGMFPRWPVGSHEGPIGWLAAYGVYWKLHTSYRVTWWYASGVSAHLDRFLFCWIKTVLCGEVSVHGFHLNAKEIGSLSNLIISTAWTRLISLKYRNLTPHLGFQSNNPSAGITISSEGSTWQTTNMTVTPALAPTEALCQARGQESLESEDQPSREGLASYSATNLTQKLNRASQSLPKLPGY